MVDGQRSGCVADRAHFRDDRLDLGLGTSGDTARRTDAGAGRRPVDVRPQHRDDGDDVAGHVATTARQGVQVDRDGASARRRWAHLVLRGDATGDRGAGRRRSRRATSCSPTRRSTPHGWDGSRTMPRSPSPSIPTRRSTRRSTAASDRCSSTSRSGSPAAGATSSDAARLADRARAAGLDVRGVMGYEGHLMMVMDRAERASRVEAAMEVLLSAHEAVGGDDRVRWWDGHLRHEPLVHRTAGRLVPADGQPLRHARPAVREVVVADGDRDLGEHQGVDRRRRRPQGARHGPRQPDLGPRRRVLLLRRAHHAAADGTRELDGRRPSPPVARPRRPHRRPPRAVLGRRRTRGRHEAIVDRWPVDLRHW